MTRTLPLAACLILFIAVIVMASNAADPQPNLKAPVAHIVFFTLADDTPENRKTLLARINDHLSGHEGTIYFSAGAIADDMQRSVNDRDFHVSLNLVFANRKAHDTYNDHPRHEEFKKINAELIKKVRVFDSYLGMQE